MPSFVQAAIVNKRLRLRADSAYVEFGDGGGSAYDTNLYRSAADTLKTDDTFVATKLLIGANSVVSFQTGAVTSVPAASSDNIGLMYRATGGLEGAAGTFAGATPGYWKQGGGIFVSDGTSWYDVVGATRAFTIFMG